MEIRIYVDFDNREVLTEKEFYKKLIEKAEEMRNDEYVFNNYLIKERGFSVSEVFHLDDPSAKNEICRQFNKYCKNKAEEALQEDEAKYYDEFILKI